MAVDFNKLSDKNKRKMLWDLCFDFISQYDTPLEVLEEIHEFLKANYKTVSERRAEEATKKAKKKRK